MITYCIYVVDDDQVTREGIALRLKKNYSVRTFSTAESAVEAVKKFPPDLLLLDIRLPGMDGIEALEAVKAINPDTVVIMITASEDVRTVVSAMKTGAYDYVLKPLQMDGLMISVQNALESIRMRKEIQVLYERYLRENLPCFIGESDAIQDVMEVVGKVAQSKDTPVFIMGETGTGKELIAGAVHYSSPNAKGPLVCVNCAAIPGDLIESELFGYEAGAFTGSDPAGKQGLAEQAEGGTLFLDEVGDLTPPAQAKVLRFLETGEYYRVGGTEKRQVQTRIISATNKDIIHMVEKKLFRSDLYYRLAVVKIEIPSLNERRDDIMPIIRHFLSEFSQKFGKTFTGISQRAEAALRKHQWKGNVRELKNMIERGVLLGDGPELEVRDVLPGYQGGRSTSSGYEKSVRLPPVAMSGVDYLNVLSSIEKLYIEKSLTLAGRNESKAARFLKISRDTFRYRRKKLKIA